MGSNICHLSSFNVSLNHVPIFTVLSQGFKEFFVLFLSPPANLFAFDLRILLWNIHGFLIQSLIFLTFFLLFCVCSIIRCLFFHSVHLGVRFGILTW